MAWCHCHAQPLRLSDTAFAPRSWLSPPAHCSISNPIGKASAFSGSKLVNRRALGVVKGVIFPVDPWAPNIDSQSIASQLFAVSLFPYIGFLYFITKSKTAPKLTLFGFYFLLAFVGATTLSILLIVSFVDPFRRGHNGAVPAGIYAKLHYGTSLSNVDWLHGGAEFLLTLTNLFIVLGLRQALRNAKSDKSDPSSKIVEEEKSPSIKG